MKGKGKGSKTPHMEKILEWGGRGWEGSTGGWREEQKKSTMKEKKKKKKKKQLLLGGVRCRCSTWPFR